MSQTHSGTTKQRSSLTELTLRSIIIGGLITLVFTAANVYLGLRVGLTFATSIPAAVISMAILRFFADHTIQENNIVQTIASAAGTISAIIFVLPGLVIVGWWRGFEYWPTVAICFLGGLLGVMYSIPFRRALVTHSKLPYPEGRAAAEVLKVGDTKEASADNSRGLKVISTGAGASAGMAILSNLGVTASDISGAFRIGTGGTLFGASLSLSLIGIGHLVGPAVGIAMLIGLGIGYLVLLPIWSQGQVPSSGAISDAVGKIFTQDVRFIGAGVIAIAAIWTLIKVMGPIVSGMRESIASSRTRHAGVQVAREEQDIPAPTVALVIVLTMIPIGGLFYLFLHGSSLVSSPWGVLVASLLFVLLVGLFVAAVCGYMAGLIGSSNSPISGVGILVALLAALLIKAVWGAVDGDHTSALVAYTLLTTAVVFGIATISNDNLQDLKTGQLVNATPWKQQVALVIGVVFGSLVVPPVLDLLANAFGFQGAPGASDTPLPAPQATLIASLVQGVFGGSLNWNLLGIGALIGVGIIVVDEILTRTTRFSLPPLAVGMGIYLPMAVTLMVPLGAFIGYFYDRWAAKTKRPAATKRLGILMATGLIVGEALWGVVFAAIVASTGNDAALVVVPDKWATYAPILGAVVFVGLIYGGYKLIATMGKNDPSPAETDAPEADAAAVTGSEAAL